MRRELMAVVLMVAAAVAFAGLAQGAEPKEGDSGTFTGTVTEKGENWFRVGEGEKSMRFMPHWRGGMPADGGGLDKEMVATIGALKVGDRVEVAWEYVEHVRAKSVRVVEKAK